MEKPGTGDRIRELGDRLGGVPKLADITGLKPTTIYGWIKGPSEPRASDLAILASSTGVSLDWLVTGEGRHETTAAITPGLLKLLLTQVFAKPGVTPLPAGDLAELIVNLVLHEQNPGIGARDKIVDFSVAAMRRKGQ